MERNRIKKLLDIVKGSYDSYGFLSDNNVVSLIRHGYDITPEEVIEFINSLIKTAEYSLNPGRGKVNVLHLILRYFNITEEVEKFIITNKFSIDSVILSNNMRYYRTTVPDRLRKNFLYIDGNYYFPIKGRYPICSGLGSTFFIRATLRGSDRSFSKLGCINEKYILSLSDFYDRKYKSYSAYVYVPSPEFILVDTDIKKDIYLWRALI